MTTIAKGGMTSGCPKEYYGLSTDVKPLATADNKIPNGSSYFEMDTFDVYFFDEENNEWRTKNT